MAISRLSASLRTFCSAPSSSFTTTERRDCTKHGRVVACCNTRGLRNLINTSVMVSGMCTDEHSPDFASSRKRVLSLRSLSTSAGGLVRFEQGSNAPAILDAHEVLMDTLRIHGLDIACRQKYGNMTACPPISAGELPLCCIKGRKNATRSLGRIRARRPVKFELGESGGTSRNPGSSEGSHHHTPCDRPPLLSKAEPLQRQRQRPGQRPSTCFSTSISFENVRSGDEMKRLGPRMSAQYSRAARVSATTTTLDCFVSNAGQRN
jgi:hypothetical protein